MQTTPSIREITWRIERASFTAITQLTCQHISLKHSLHLSSSQSTMAQGAALLESQLWLLLSVAVTVTRLELPPLLLSAVDVCGGDSTRQQHADWRRRRGRRYRDAVPVLVPVVGSTRRAREGGHRPLLERRCRQLQQALGREAQSTFTNQN